MAILTYDPKQFSLIVGGKIIQGFADGTFIAVSRDQDMFKLVIGADGNGTRVKSNDKSSTITITLLQSSPSNDVLSAIGIADELANSGTVPILLRDGSGRTACTALTCWLKKMPDFEFSNDKSTRAWVFHTDKMDIFIGGN